MTDSKTAMDYSMEAYRYITENGASEVVILRALESYASDKDKRIAQLEAEVIGLKTWSETLKDSIRLKDGLWEQRLGELTSIKSSLAEKESEVYKLQHRLCGCYELASIDRPCDGLVHKEDELNSLKEENVDLKQQIEVWRHHHEEHTNLEVDLAQAQLASLKEQAHIDKDFILQYQREVAKLQLENGVMRSALERINEYCNDPSCGSVSKHALSTSTKSSLMEKVRGLIEAAEPFVRDIDKVVQVSRAERRLESALTEVKKEIGE